MICNLMKNLLQKQEGEKITVIARSDHHGSKGGYYLVRNKGAYKLVENSSVAQYTTKTPSNIKDDKLEKMWVNKVEKLIDLHLNDTITDIGRYIRNVSVLIYPVFNVVCNMQKKYGNINLN